MRLVIATPVRGADPMSAPVSYGYSLFRAALVYSLGADIEPIDVGFCADVVRARNRVAAQVLRKPEPPDLVLWLDDDQWADDPGIIRRMIDTGEDLISAPYTNKSIPTRWVHQPLPDSGPPTDPVWPVMGVGFGMTITTRRCLERVTAAAEVYWDAPKPHYVADVFGHVFDRDPASGERIKLSEDFSFCKRWRDLGGQVSVYNGPGNLVHHAGAHSFSAKDIPRSVS